MEKIALAPTDKAGADHTAALAALKAGDVVNVGGHPFTVNRVVDSAGGLPGTKVLRFDSPGPASDLFAEGAVVKISAGATDGDVLTLAGGKPAWLPAAGGGDEVYIGPDDPTDNPDVTVWINPAEQGGPTEAGPEVAVGPTEPTEPSVLLWVKTPAPPTPLGTWDFIVFPTPMGPGKITFTDTQATTGAFNINAADNGGTDHAAAIAAIGSGTVITLTQGATSVRLTATGPPNTFAGNVVTFTHTGGLGALTAGPVTVTIGA
jgi:hypothetical protein